MCTAEELSIPQVLLKNSWQIHPLTSLGIIPLSHGPITHLIIQQRTHLIHFRIADQITLFIIQNFYFLKQKQTAHSNSQRRQMNEDPHPKGAGRKKDKGWRKKDEGWRQESSVLAPEEFRAPIRWQSCTSGRRCSRNGWELLPWRLGLFTQEELPGPAFWL